MWPEMLIRQGMEFSLPQNEKATVGGYLLSHLIFVGVSSLLDAQDQDDSPNMMFFARYASMLSLPILFDGGMEEATVQGPGCGIAIMYKVGYRAWIEQHLALKIIFHSFS